MTPPLLDPLNVPEELRDQSFWICWREERRGEKIDKIPVAPWRTGDLRSVNVTDPTNYTDFKTAMEIARQRQLGVGFVFTKDNPFFGVDIDDCVVDGKIEDWALEIVRDLDTYAEISPSGRGIKLIGKCAREKPEINRRFDDIGLEIYTHSRFFTITGRVLPEAPREIKSRKEQLLKLVAKYATLPIERLPGEAAKDVPILKVLPEGHLQKMRRVGDKFRGPHFAHESHTGTNFVVDPAKGAWFCFRHTRGGGWLSLLAIREGLVKCEEIGEKGTAKLSGEVLAATLKRAKELGLIEEVKEGEFPEEFFDESGRFVPRYLAEHLLRETPVATHRESWVIYRYKGGVYLPDGEATIREEARKHLGDMAKDKFIDEVVSHIRDTTFTDPKKFEASAELLCVENGILNVLTGELKPHTPEIIFLQKLPVKFDPGAKCPTTLLRLWEWTGNLTGLVRVIQFAGFCLYRDYFIRKAVIIHGEGSNGKTTFISWLTSWLGEENVTSVKVQALDRRFVPARLYGKLANLCDELPSEEWMSTEAFKQATGGSIVEAEKKFKEPFAFRSYAKMLFAGNRLPIVSDDTKAFWDRITIIPFENTFNGGKARERAEILKEMLTEEEKSGFLNLALVGLKTLLETLEFYAQEDNEEVKRKYVRISDPVMAFAKECIVEDIMAETPKAEVYSAYVKYCEAHDFPVKENNAFARSLKRVYPRLEERRVEASDGRQTRVWAGIKLIPWQPAETQIQEENCQDIQDIRVFPLFKNILDFCDERLIVLRTLIQRKISEKPGEPGEPGSKESGERPQESPIPSGLHRKLEGPETEKADSTERCDAVTPGWIPVIPTQDIPEILAPNPDDSSKVIHVGPLRRGLRALVPSILAESLRRRGAVNFDLSLALEDKPACSRCGSPNNLNFLHGSWVCSACLESSGGGPGG